MSIQAIVYGQPYGEIPSDLYIPPEALEVFLETFEGPLDLLLYLIRKQNIDILDIPILAITEQYMAYVMLMKSLKLELAADYLVMAAMLAEIKSSLLLPKLPSAEGAEEVDPRAELVKRLQIYEQMKQAAQDLTNLPQFDKDFFWAQADAPKSDAPKTITPIELNALIQAMQDVLGRLRLRKHHEVKFENISVRERMSEILIHLTEKKTILFVHCFRFSEGRMGVVATFIAVLELLKMGQIALRQEEAFSPISLYQPEPFENLPC